MSLLSLEEAQARILSQIEAGPVLSRRLSEALGFHAAESVFSPLPLPLFDNSAMDGYAVKAADLSKASAVSPVPLRQIGSVPAGSVFSGTVRTGECVRIFTGSAVPTGADAVIMQEDVTAKGTDEIQCLDSVRPFENIRLAGEDLSKGSEVIRAGTGLTPLHLSLLAALGLAEVKVRQAPSVWLLGTGSELVRPGERLAPGKIFESNSHLLSGLVKEAGACVGRTDFLADQAAEIRDWFQHFARDPEAGIAITSGGASVGEHDLIKQAFQEAGGSLEFWKVAIKPGKPFLFGRVGKKFLFGLPGNPVSAFVTFMMLARPALLKAAGAAQVFLPSIPGRLNAPVENRGDRRHFLRVRIDRDGTLTVLPRQASHALSHFADANGFLDVPPETQWAPGRDVTVLHWNRLPLSAAGARVS